MENLRWKIGPLPEVTELRRGRAALMAGLSFMLLLYNAFFRSH